MTRFYSYLMGAFALTALLLTLLLTALAAVWVPSLQVVKMDPAKVLSADT